MAPPAEILFVTYCGPSLNDEDEKPVSIVVDQKVYWLLQHDHPQAWRMFLTLCHRHNNREAREDAAN